MTFFGVNCPVDRVSVGDDDQLVPSKTSTPAATPEAVALARRIELAVELSRGVLPQSLNA
jgi:hypothetical protein